jgi:hypothetical protein
MYEIPSERFPRENFLLGYEKFSLKISEAKTENIMGEIKFNINEDF